MIPFDCHQNEWCNFLYNFHFEGNWRWSMFLVAPFEIQSHTISILNGIEGGYCFLWSPPIAITNEWCNFPYHFHFERNWKWLLLLVIHCGCNQKRMVQFPMPFPCSREFEVVTVSGDPFRLQSKTNVAMSHTFPILNGLENCRLQCVQLRWYPRPALTC